MDSRKMFKSGGNIRRDVSGKWKWAFVIVRVH